MRLTALVGDGVEARRREELSRRREQLQAGGVRAAVAKFEQAAAAVHDCLRGLSLVDLGPLKGSPLSPNVLRAVRLADGREGVLKLVGEAVTGEAATLEAGTAAGVACVPSLSMG